MNGHLPFSLVGGNGSKCPIAAIRALAPCTFKTRAFIDFAFITGSAREQRWQDTPIPKPLPFPPNSPRGISVQIDPLLFA